MDEKTTDAYLERIGAERPRELNLESLATLYRRHQLTVPWENLGKFLDEPIVVDEDAIIDKIVRRRRGGGCIELNGGFGLLLRALGFHVDLLVARLFYDGGMGIPFDHLCLRVMMPAPYLLDAGIAGFSRVPLRMDDTEDQIDAMGRFRLVPAPDGDIDVHVDGKPRYRVEPRSRELEDFKVSLWWHLTSPISRVTSEDYPFVWLPTDDGQIMLHRRNFARERDGEWFGETYENDEQTLAAYEKHFGVVLDRVPDETGPAVWTRAV